MFILRHMQLLHYCFQVPVLANVLPISTLSYVPAARITVCRQDFFFPAASKGLINPPV